MVDFVHFLRQVHHTEIRKLMDKVVVMEVRKAHQQLLVKVHQGRWTDYFVQTSRKEVVRREVRVIIVTSPNAHK